MTSLRSFLFAQIIRQFYNSVRYGVPFKNSDLYKGYKLYKNTPPSFGKKSVIKVLVELSTLTRYWKAFPDTYFRFGMFLKNYTDKDKMKSFVPQGAYYRLSADKTPKYHVLIDDKILFHDIMQHYGLPVPYRFFTFRNNVFRCGPKFLSDIEVDNIIGKIDDDRIFVKRFTGGAATGVSVFQKRAIGKYVDLDGEEVSAKMIRTKYAGQDFFFEKQIKQEHDLRQFNPDTVNTIRVLTFNNHIISASVRFGGKGDFIDNISKGGVAVSIDIETGMLGNFGMRKYDIQKYYEHPDSHIRFEGTKVTQWNEVKNVVEKTMQYLPYYKSVGYDIATTDNGPIIIEINTGAGIGLSQIGKDYGLRESFRKD